MDIGILDQLEALEQRQVALDREVEWLEAQELSLSSDAAAGGLNIGKMREFTLRSQKAATEAQMIVNGLDALMKDIK
ncbi:hypothetical protein CJD35_02680 [Sphingobium xenophagum]|uniref:Uncharacterized protein n=1 Tax=Sphingobium xenophagum TaxID=121428 RepID=A0A249MQ48_SPHXE|nr:hypothetical protein [Sphingobium xenophagum]ASY43481.1 hypothetical protein CJD35_02680 [Sphingobium xenophagum]